MICIRFFKTRKEAEWAKKILEESGIKGIVSEDKFNNVPIQKFGVRARFRINVDDEDFDRALNFLAKRLRASRIT
jgi:hypothetical protein